MTVMKLKVKWTKLTVSGERERERQQVEVVHREIRERTVFTV
jgi:HSP20 family molecular chaperone IbpA